MNSDLHESLGRYNFRKEVCTSDAPFLLTQSSDLLVHNLALYLLVDRSGSMCNIEEPVCLVLMSLYLAANELEIPAGLAFFGANYEHSEKRLLEVTSPVLRVSKATKALIAGFNGVRTHNKLLSWSLLKAEEALCLRPERCKVLLVIHDGDSVYKGADGNDLALNQTYVSRLEC